MHNSEYGVKICLPLASCYGEVHPSCSCEYWITAKRKMCVCWHLAFSFLSLFFLHSNVHLMTTHQVNKYMLSFYAFVLGIVAMHAPRLVRWWVLWRNTTSRAILGLSCSTSCSHLPTAMTSLEARLVFLV